MYNHKTLFLFVVLFSVLLNGCGESAPGVDGQSIPDPNEILEREQQRVEFLSGGELDRLSELMSPTMTYTHSNGSLDNKEQFLSTLQSGQVVYRNLDHDNLEVRFVNPDVAILNGTSDVSVTVGGADSEVALRFTIVYVRSDGEWMFEAWHSSARQN